VAECPAEYTSPDILTKVGLLDLLQLLSEEVVVPAAVWTEIQQYGVMDVTVQALAQSNWLVVVEPLRYQSQSLLVI
jgi:predicted nucleic acid-binding protein